jgi:hypothetical protein
MYIIEVQARVSGITLYVESLTATSASFTNDWRRAERFSNNELPKAEDIERFDVRLIGYDAV